jgi:exodeoxyribonuclease V alpha subunit
MANVFAQRHRDRMQAQLTRAKATALSSSDVGRDGAERAIVTGQVDALNDQAKPDGSWVAGTLLADDGATKIPFVGTDLPGCEVGCAVRLVGEWESHPEYGLQFRAVDVESRLPTTPDATIRYIAGHVHGCGPSRAQALVEHFGPATLETLALGPERVREVFPTGKVGTTLETAWRRWAAEYRATAGAQRLAIDLMGAGMTYQMARRIQRHFDGVGQAQDVILHHPYRLVEVPGIGFKTADGIALGQGVQPTDPSRVAAGVVHALEVAMGLGHSALPRPALEKKAQEALGVTDPVLITAAIDRGLAAGTLVEDAALLFLPAALRAEHEVADAIATLVQASYPLDAASAATVESLLETRLADGTLSSTQAGAVRMALASGFSILTGRPGSGKTTTVRTFIACCQALGWGVAVAAPTGKAAARAAEVTGLPAKTVHRLIGTPPGERGDVPLEARVVVLDEVSMADLDLVAWLLRNVDPARTAILFVGDNDQLPSVGHGRVLGDLLDAEVLPSIELTEIFRQAAGSLITRNAHRLLDGQELILDNAPAADFLFADVTPEPPRGKDGFPLAEDPTRGEREAAEVYLRLARSIRWFVEQKRAVPVRDIQVLSPMRKGPLGVDALNLWLQQALNPHGADGPLIASGARVRIGDRVIQIKNDYSVPGGLFNGEQGEVVSVDRQKDSVTVRFDERTVTLGGFQLRRLQLAWAITVHRAQGSEYLFTILVLTAAHWVMLERALFYTAMTRARKLFLLIGTMAAVKRILQAGRRASPRHTGLAARVRALVSSPALSSGTAGSSAP